MQPMKITVFLVITFICLVQLTNAARGRKKPKQCSDLQEGDLATLNDRPAKIIEITENGNTVNLLGVDIFTDEEYEGSCRADDTLKVPDVKITDYELSEIKKNQLNLLTEDGIIIRVKSPEGALAEKLNAAFVDGKHILISVAKAGREEKVIEIKTGKQ